MLQEELKFYNRQIILSEIGLEGQEKLKNAKVLVIGAGGLGCPVLQYLAAAGIGTIGIIDNDDINISNLHRQILYSVTDVGKNKAEIAAQKLLLLNPFITVHSYPFRLTINNAADIFLMYDLIVDGSDNFETRYLINDACVEAGKPFVFGSIFGFEGQLSVFNYKGCATYRCVFPEAGQAPNCETNGVLGVLPGIIGCYMANEALKIILSIGETLAGKLSVIDVLSNTFTTFKVKRLAENTSINPINKTNEILLLKPINISITDLDNLLKQEPEVMLIDVRELHEFEADNIGGINIPLCEIPDQLHNFKIKNKIVFYCKSGIRSKAAADMLISTGYTAKVYWI